MLKNLCGEIGDILYTFKGCFPDLGDFFPFRLFPMDIRDCDNAEGLSAAVQN